MSYVSLYRKWRPQTFKEVIGQNHITQTLCNAVKENRLSHAYLFCGSRGTGKTTVARILAKALNCAQGPTPDPCNECQVCLEINGDSSMDVLEIDAASNRGIDEIRNLREKVHFVPAEGRYKVYIIDEVHMLTPEAFNALLKTLEEPPPHVIFVLATTESHKVLPTIHSRCQRFDFRRILVSDIVGRLQQIAEAEQIQADEGVLMMIARQAQGSMRDAISTLDQLSSFTGKKIDLDSVTALLGVVDVDMLFEMADIIREKNTSEALFFIDRLVESGRDIRQFVKELIEHFRHLFIIKYADKPDEIVNVTSEILPRLKAQADDFKSFELMRFIELLTGTFNEMKWNPDARLLLEVALVKLTRLEVDVSLEGILYRLEEVEKSLMGSTQSAERLGQETRAVREASVSEKTAEEIFGSKPADTSEQPSNLSKKGQEKKLKADGVKKEKTAQKEDGKEIAGAVRPDASIGDTQVEAKKQAARSEEETGEERQAAAAPGATSPSPVELAKIKRAWPVIMEQIKKKRLPVYTLLLECQPSEVVGRTIVLKFRDVASFHKKEVEKPQNLSFIKNCIKDIIGVDVNVSCGLGESVLADKYPQSEQETEKPALQTQTVNADVSKHHLLKLVFDDFGAEIVDEIKLEEESP